MVSAIKFTRFAKLGLERHRTVENPKRINKDMEVFCAAPIAFSNSHNHVKKKKNNDKKKKGMDQMDRVMPT